MASSFSAQHKIIPILLTGLGLSVVNLHHLTIETKLPGIVLGGILPLVTSVGIVAVGSWVYWQGWSAQAVTTLTKWFVLGIVWMLVVGIGLTLYEFTEGTIPPDLWYLIAMFASYGSIPAFVTGWYDIQRQAKERSLERSNVELRRNHAFLSRIEDIADIGGWEIDPTDDIVEWTEGGRRIHNFPDASPRSIDSVLERYREADRKRLETAIDHCRRDGIPFELELQMQTFDDRTRWVRIRGERERRDGDTVIRGAIQDITQLKEREQRLMVLNRILRHNIRNELNVIAGNAELLTAELHRVSRLPFVGADDSFGDVARRLSEGCEAMTVDVDRMQHLIDELDDVRADELLSRTKLIQKTSHEVITLAEKTRRFEEAIDKDFSIETVSPSMILTELAEQYERMYPGSTIDLAVEEGTVVGNKTAIRIIFDELLENAITHQQEGDRTVSISVVERSHSVTVSIADTGPGLPDMEREVLEEGRETALMHGSGIGLWIVNWLTKRLEGEVTIRENSPRGTVINIHLQKPSESPAG